MTFIGLNCGDDGVQITVESERSHPIRSACPDVALGFKRTCVGTAIGVLKTLLQFSYRAS